MSGPYSPVQLCSGIKEKIDAMVVINDRIYIASGLNLLVYTLSHLHSTSLSDPTYLPTAKLLTTKKSIFRKTVDQLLYVQAAESLAILSDGNVTLWDLPNLKLGSVLSQGKAVMAVAGQSCWVNVEDTRKVRGKSEVEGSESVQADDGSSTAGKEKVLVSTLVLGCRKKVVVLTWTEGKPGLTRDLVLPHSPRLILFTSPHDTAQVHLFVSATESLLLTIPLASTLPLKVIDSPPISLPTTSSSTGGNSQLTPSTSTTGGGGLGFGLGYMGKGLGLGGLGSGKTSGITGTTVGNGEVLSIRDGQGVFMSPEGKLARNEVIEWIAPPDDIIYESPYIITALPPNNNSSSTTGSSTSTTLQLRLSANLRIQQNIQLYRPSTSPISLTHTDSGQIIRLLSTSNHDMVVSDIDQSGSERPNALFCIAASTDKTQLSMEGNSIWAFRSITWQEQLDTLIHNGRFSDGLSLLDSLPHNTPVDRRKMETLLKMLDALSLFGKQQWEKAMELFVQLDINPGKVIALYPEGSVAGRLHIPQEQWVETFGGPMDGHLEGQPLEGQEIEHEVGTGRLEKAGGVLKSLTHFGTNAGKQPGSAGVASLDGRSSKPGSVLEEPTSSSKGSIVEFEVVPPAALEALVHYLSDRRQKLAGAIQSLKEPLPFVDRLPPFKSIPKEDLLQLPSVPFQQLTPEQLVRVSQIVYTALLKVYLAIRPVLVGSLCRIENWCEVEEVEELLKERKKFTDLVDLYQGKKLHEKALNLLRELSKDEEDPLDAYPPTIRYLQKLGPSHINLIFQCSRWLFESAPRQMSLQVFTADEPEVEALPRHDVMKYLEEVDREACRIWLEHVTKGLGESGPEFGDKLGELYLEEARKEGPKGEMDPTGPANTRLLTFLRESQLYRADRILGRLKDDELPRARAILLGQLGNHEGALGIYVNRLKSYRDAEEYCSRVYEADSNPRGIFLVLLRLYLRPAGNSPPLLEPALSLISTYSLRLDPLEVINLLPPPVTLNDISRFMVKVLTEGKAKTREREMVKRLTEVRREEVSREVMKLQEKRVRITDIRLCPQCHKRIGQSVIAVHTPRGEVTHYQCKDGFAARLAASRA